MDREISTCLKGQRNLSLSKRTEITSRLRFLSESRIHRRSLSPSRLSPRQNQFPPQSVFCLLFMNLLFEGAGPGGWRDSLPLLFSCWFRVGRPKVPTEHGRGERPHGWRNQILTLEPFREEEKTTAGTRRLELQLRKCGRGDKRHVRGKEEEIP